MKKKHWLDTYAVVEDLLQRKCWGTFLVGSLLIIGRYALVGGGIASAGYFYSTSNNTQTSRLNSSQNSQNGASSQVVISSDAKLPISDTDGVGGVIAGDSTEKNVDFNESDWDLNASVVKQKEENSYCVRERKGFEGGEKKKKKKLRIGEAVKIRFSLKSDENVKDAVQLPKLILLYGRREDNSPSYRMFFPDVDTGFIGFESISSGKKQTQSSHLLRPLDYSSVQEIELEYSVESLHSNDALFQYKLAYVPTSDDGKQVTNEGSFQSSFPWPNAKNTEQEFGLGAFTGTCFHIISFEKGFQ